jgi:hypothetical protein
MTTPPVVPMPPPLATLEQLGARLGVVFPVDVNGMPTTPDGLRAGAALNDASALVRTVAGEDWLDENGDLEAVPPTIQTVTLSVASRAYMNPQGAVQATVGDASVTYSRGGEGTVFLTNAEVRLIRKAMGLSALSSVQFVTEFVPPNGRDNLYAPDPDGGDPVPLGPVPWER